MALRELARPLQHREGGVALVEMADLDLRVQRLHQAPAADAQHDLLHQPHLAAAAVQLAGDAAIGRAVHRVVAVQQIEQGPPDHDAPHPHLQDTSRQLDRDVQPAAAGHAHRLDRHARRVVVRERLELAARGVDHLAEVALLVQQADADDRHAQVARRFQQIAGQHAEPAGIQRQRIAEAELHAEIGHPGQRHPARPVGEPAAVGQVGAPRRDQLVEMRDEAGIGGEFGQRGGRGVLQDGPWVVRALPQLRIDPRPQRVGLMAPGPAQVQRQVAQRGQRRRQFAPGGHCCALRIRWRSRPWRRRARRRRSRAPGSG